jgi:RNA polymerase sigma-70 factor (ECF subfamily)
LALTREQLDALYRNYAPGAFRRARRLLGSEADAHELLHDVFLSLWARPGQYAEKSQLSTFLYAAVTHACLKRLRDRGNRARLSVEHRQALLSVAARGQGLRADESAALRSALERMPEPLAQLAVYCYFDELTQEEIARLMGCSRRHVVDLVQRLHAWVRRQEAASCAT